MFLLIQMSVSPELVGLYGEGLRMLFVQNVGQLPNEVVFYSMHPTTAYVLKDGTIHINGVRVSFGTKPRFITGDMPLKTKVSYFGQGKAISNVPTYRRVVLKEVYPKIDAVLTADGRGVVELQFIVRPGGDPEQIRVETDGDMKVEGDGLYIVKDGKKVVKISGLKAYQGAEEVEVRPVLSGNTLKFAVGEYDRRHTLVIDPIVAAILASSSVDAATSVAVSPDGYVFVAGETALYDDFAPNAKVFGSTFPYYFDAFVSKLSNDLTEHIATAVLGSEASDGARAVLVSRSGEVFVAGWTQDYYGFAPSRKVFGKPGGGTDAFVSKLSGDLNRHISTVILASSRGDRVESLSMDGDGNVFALGITKHYEDFATNMVVFGSPGRDDIFVSKLTNDLTEVIATAVLGSEGLDLSRSVAVGPKGDVYITGFTLSSEEFDPDGKIIKVLNLFPHHKISSYFVGRLSNGLDSLTSTVFLPLVPFLWSIPSIAVDSNGDVFIAGTIGNPSIRLPKLRVVVGNPFKMYVFYVFVAKFTEDLKLLATAALSHKKHNFAYAIAVDDSGNVFVAGITQWFMVEPPDIGPPYPFVSKLSSDLSRHLATVLLSPRGGAETRALAVGPRGYVFVAGIAGDTGTLKGEKRVFGDVKEGNAFVVRVPGSLDVR